MAIIKVRNSGIDNTVSLGTRNLLINGEMMISQRAGSFTGGTSQFYTLDRWLAAVGSAFNYDVTVTQDNTVPSGAGFKHSLKVTSNSVKTPTGSENGGISQRLEGQNLYRLNWGSSDAKDITLSFWVRSSKTGTYTIQLQQNVGSGGAAVYSHVKEYTISAADTWEKKTITFPGNTVQAQTQSTGDGLRVNWWLSMGPDDNTTPNTWQQNGAYLATSNQVNWMDTSGATFYLTGCQLEEGNVATDFERLSEASMLSLCQRYYQNCGRWHVQGYGYSTATDGSGSSMMWATTMRTAPTVTKSAGTDGGSGADMVFNEITAFGCSPEAVSTNSSYGQWYIANVVAEAEL